VLARFLHPLKKHINSLTIRRKLLLAFLAVAVVPMAIMGVFAVASLMRSTADNANASLADKLRIARLLWDVRLNVLSDTSRAVAQDNMVQLNMDLGLHQALGAYLGVVGRRADLSLAFILDSQGQLVAASDREYVAAGENPLPDSLLATAVVGPTVATVHLRGTSLVPEERLGTDGATGEMAILAIHPIINTNQILTGYAVAAMVFGLEDRAGSAGFVADMHRQLGMPVVLAWTGRILASSEGGAAVVLPAGLEGMAGKDLVPAPSALSISGKAYLGQFQPVLEFEGRPVHLGVASPEADLVFGRNLTMAIFLVVILVAFAMTVLVSLTLSRSIARPMVAVSEGAREIVNGNFNVRIEVPSHDEVGLMAEEFNQMTLKLSEIMQRLACEVEEHQAAERQVRSLNDDLEARVAERTRELTGANEALADSLNLLRRTQKHLVETEKLAALGNLVAGLAHELNTPIGVSLTASSYLETRTKELEAQVAANQLTRLGLDSFLAQVREAAAMLGTTLSRTAEQIRFFKQIAVDQDTGESVDVDLKLFIDDLNLSLGHHLQRGGHAFQNHLDNGLVLHTWPGPLYQILSNIVMNALQHGFHEREGGTIAYRAERNDGRIVLVVSDDGAGMGAEVLGHIFEPFFTTKRGTGRTGLGLSIVYNLVTVKLGGEIGCRSTPDGGTIFRIVLPVGPLELLPKA
jgi:C4-dicarboxylate-specific signal transduction histidine kinase